MFESRGKLRGRVKLSHLEILQLFGLWGEQITRLNYALKTNNKPNKVFSFCNILPILNDALIRFIKFQSTRPIFLRNQQIVSIRAGDIKLVLNTGVKQIKTSAITKNGESLEMSFQ